MLHPHKPTVVEIVDTAEAIDAALPALLKGVPESVVVLRERVRVERGGMQ